MVPPGHTRANYLKNVGEIQKVEVRIYNCEFHIFMQLQLLLLEINPPDGRRALFPVWQRSFFLPL